MCRRSGELSKRSRGWPPEILRWVRIPSPETGQEQAGATAGGGQAKKIQGTRFATIDARYSALQVHRVLNSGGCRAP